MTDKLQKKYDKLINEIKSRNSIAVAFSGGVDSAFLLKAAVETLGDKVIAITATSPAFINRETKEAYAFCKAYGIKQITFEFNQLEIKEFRENTPDRCYHCKKMLFLKIKEAAENNDILTVLDGTNADDINDYRPGMKAAEELGIISPLSATDFSKAEIREMSEKLGLPTYNKPSLACLASRIAYGEEITAGKLLMTGKAEELLSGLGFEQSRVRVHGRLARIEISSDDFCKIITPDTRRLIYDKFREIGFDYVSLDLLGYRTGSMNEVLR